MERRMVLRGLLAAGGLSALSACLGIEGSAPGGDPDRRPDRQHAWNEYLEEDEYGNRRPPEHHVFLHVSYDGNDREGDRELLETALTDLERAYETSPDGLLFTVGYSPAYFGRFGESLDGVDLPAPEPLHEDEDPDIMQPDLYVHLASDRASAPMAAREALFGDTGANGTSVQRIDDVFSVASRRTGFVGPGLPKENEPNTFGIPTGKLDGDAPTLMNFRSGFRQTQATEERVTIQDGPFAGGTTQHVERVILYLHSWFGNSPDEQVARLFAPDLDTDDVGEIGELLTDNNQVGSVDFDRLKQSAENDGVVGHAQKMSRFREENGRPPILRRDVNFTDGEGGMSFVTLHREFEDYRKLRLGMEGIDVAEETGIERRTNNGILDYIRTIERGNFLVPPREQRALPEA